MTLVHNFAGDYGDSIYNPFDHWDSRGQWWYVYVIVEHHKPLDVFYIGCTRRPGGRYGNLIGTLRIEAPLKHNIRMHLVARLPSENKALAYERRLIQDYDAAGFDLLNEQHTKKRE